jgi:iron complex outermembrane recepter protein
MCESRALVATAQSSWLMVLLAAFSGTTFAQQVTSPDMLQQIVVTATRRESTAQTTPVSLTVVSGADIEARGLADMNAIVQSVPGVSMRTSGPGQTEIEMRGMTSGGGYSATVGVYLDDTSMTAPANSTNGHVVIDPNLYDLSRVEVLRGPQGTLYGAGSMGGTVKFVSNAPNPEAFDASAQTILSDTDGGGFNHGENGMLNIPLLNGTAALRLVGSQDHESGWIDRIVIANGDFPLETNNLTTRGNILSAPLAADYKGVNDEDLTSVRVALLWKPIDQLAIMPSYFYQRIQQDGLSDIDSNPGTNAHYQPFNTPEPFSDRFGLASLNLKYIFSAFDLDSTTSQWTRDETNYQDGSEQLQWVLSTPTAILPFYTSQGGIGPGTSLEDDRTQQTSEELRLTSSGNSSFQWLVGYFYADFLNTASLLFLYPGAAPLFGTSNVITAYQPIKNIQNAFFGEVSYQLTPKLKATAGLRHYKYDSSFNLTYSGILATGSNAVASYGSPENAQGVIPKFNLSFQLDENLLLYATAAKGFRPGGAQGGAVPVSGPVGGTCEANLQALYGTSAFVPSPVAFEPDSVWSYELGEKATVIDSRLTINSAGYFMKWNAVAQSVTLPCGFIFTANAGDAQIYGGEIELNTQLTQGLSLLVNAGYTHATLVTELVGTGITPGTPLQDVPEWTSSASLVYRHGISDQLRFTARIENDYVGAHTDAAYSIYHLPSYDLTSVRVGLEGDRWMAVLFAKNLFNSRALLSDTPQINAFTPTFNRIAVTQPTTVGIDLSYRFKQ